MSMKTSLPPSTTYNAVVILGGGLASSTQPNRFVEERIKVAAQYSSDTQYYILSSRGTPHKPPPLDGAHFPVDESVVSARSLLQLLPTVDPDTLLLDQWSLDTIGNAWFALTNFVEPMQLSSILVVTSAFHMPRSEAIFKHIFSLSSLAIDVQFVAAADVGIDPALLLTRRQKEASSLQNWLKTMQRCTTKQQMAHFLFVEHGAYNGRNAVAPPAAPPTAASSADNNEEQRLKNSY